MPPNLPLDSIATRYMEWLESHPFDVGMSSMTWETNFVILITHCISILWYSKHNHFSLLNHVAWLRCKSFSYPVITSTWLSKYDCRMKQPGNRYRIYSSFASAAYETFVFGSFWHTNPSLNSSTLCQKMGTGLLDHYNSSLWTKTLQNRRLRLISVLINNCRYGNHERFQERFKVDWDCSFHDSQKR